MNKPGVLIVRGDGTIPVDDATPVTRGLVDAIERLLDALGAPQTMLKNNKSACDSAGQEE